MVPGMSVPSTGNRPNGEAASPAAPSLPMLPSFGGAPRGESSVESLTEEIGTLQEKRAAAEAQMAALKEKQAQLIEEQANAPRYSFQNYTSIEPLHLKIFVKTILYATLVTLIAFVVCYPVAYFASNLKGALGAGAILLLLVVPYSINELLRVYAWVMILAREGVLNSGLQALGVIGSDPPQWVASNNSVFLVMAYAYILFMMFPLMNTLGTLDRSQVEAARDLGASVWRVHYRVVLPHAKPGIAMGAIVVFMLSAGVITVPELVGRGLHPDWFSQVIYRRFFDTGDWNQGSAYSLMLLASCIVFILMVLSLYLFAVSGMKTALARRMRDAVSALDPAAIKAVEAAVREFHQRGTRIVMTTHDLHQARRLAGDVLFLSGGKIREHTPSDVFFDKPASREAQAFIAGELVE